MSVGLLGRKIGMTQVYDADGALVPVTVIEAGPCVVLQLRTRDRDGYEAVQLGFDDKPRRLATRSERGQVAEIGGKRQKQRSAAGVEAPPKPGCEPKRFIREFRADGQEHGYQVGQALTVALFASPGTRPKQGPDGKEVKGPDGKPTQEPIPVYIDVIGTSKGRGTAGVMKRHNFNGQRASHGVKRVHRHPGSIGMSADPSRTIKGKRMAGHYGHARVTKRNLKVVRVDAERNMLLVAGAVPGPNGGYIMVRPTNKHRRATTEKK
jgi:large subunit ribosomal protein L3